MGVPTSEVGYTSATTGMGDHEVHKGHVVALKSSMSVCAVVDMSSLVVGTVVDMSSLVVCTVVDMQPLVVHHSVCAVVDM
jgi:hypothetical protein